MRLLLCTATTPVGESVFSKPKGILVIVVDCVALPFPFWGSTFREEFGCKVLHVFSDLSASIPANYDDSRSMFLKDFAGLLRGVQDAMAAWFAVGRVGLAAPHSATALVLGFRVLCALPPRTTPSRSPGSTCAAQPFRSWGHRRGVMFGPLAGIVA